MSSDRVAGVLLERLRARGLTDEQIGQVADDFRCTLFGPESVGPVRQGDLQDALWQLSRHDLSPTRFRVRTLAE